jgi:peptidoglycan biosynthesis protein MviN/MurJ (putative lipid II flippase)
MLMPVIGFAGAALGWTIGAIVNALILWVVLQRKIGAFVQSTFVRAVIKVIVASVGMGVGIYLLQQFTNGWNLYMELIGAIGVGGLLYGLILILLKEPLTLELVIKIKHKLIRTR